jgi:hypothetical protein
MIGLKKAPKGNVIGTKDNDTAKTRPNLIDQSLTEMNNSGV